MWLICGEGISRWKAAIAPALLIGVDDSRGLVCFPAGTG